MPHTALNRVIVRMLFDPLFVEQVYTAPEPTLRPLEIPDHLVTELLKTDRRAWQVDTERRKRTLHSLIGEFKCSTTLALSETGSIGLLDAFFSHHLFHRSVQTRGSLSDAFAKYLTHLHTEGNVTHPHYLDLLTLEATKAQCRRELTETLPSPSRDGYSLPPGVHSKELNGNVIPALNQIEHYLYELSLLPALALCEDRPAFPSLPPVSSPTHFLFRPREGEEDIHLSPVSVVVHDALNEMKSPLSREGFLKKMKRRGLSTERANELLDALLEEGLLYRLPLTPKSS